MSDKRTQGVDTNGPSRWKNRVIVFTTGLVFIGAMAAGIAGLHGQANAERSAEPFPPIAVEARKIELSDAYSVKDRFVGLLEPARQTFLSFERAGLLTEILYDEGAEVAQGDVVARLDTSKLMSERRRLEARARELEARYELAAVTLSRQGALREKGWQSDQKYDEARFTAAQLSSAIRGIEASIESIDIDIAKSELKAPFSGRVAERKVDEGSVVGPGTAVIQIMESQNRHARVGMSVDASNSLSAGHAFQLIAGGSALDARIVSMRPDLETGSRTVTVLFEVNGAEHIRFGEIVELVVDRPVTARGAWLPLDALTEGAKGLWSVFLVVEKDGGPTVAREVVEILHVDDRRVYVRGNLTGDSQIIVSGTNRIISGQTVAVQRAGRES